MKKICLLFLFVCTYYCTVFADIRLPKLFGDSMVLQRDRPVAVWGWASANEKITVKFHQQIKTTQCNADGTWKVMLEPEKAGGPYKLTVSGKNTIVLNDILMGEVWVCSGQSNMEMAVKYCINAAEEIKAADFPQIRQFAVQRDMSGTPKDDLTYAGNWKPATSANVADFTAVGYFYAVELYRKLKIPVGLIHSSWGGTNVETWISKEGYAESNDFKQLASLPVLNIDSFITAKKDRIGKMITGLQGALPAASVPQSWKAVDFDDKSWPTMNLPGVWENQQLKNFDGIVWFRKAIYITGSQVGKSATLNVGMIDDSDETYVNGQLVGKMNFQAQTKRSYKIPAGILKEGKNIIAIRVEDPWGNGGIAGNKEDVNLEIESGKTQSLAGAWSFQVESIADNAFSVSPNNYPSLLFNAMINPITPFTMQGVLWYQGESNAGRAYEYRKSFSLLIEDWRKRWNDEDFPFYFVQLSSFNSANGNSNNGSTWAELREAQEMATALPNTGMAVTTDIGNATDIHPQNKQDVGKRLAAVALHQTYGQKVLYAGPTYELMKVEGDKVTIVFSQTHTGLMAKDKYGYVKGFEIAGADKKFYYAKAMIVGHRIVVSADSVPNPVAVRYAWADDAGEANLYNKEGFPAAPFRTDQWEAITKEQAYKPAL